MECQQVSIGLGEMTQCEDFMFLNHQLDMKSNGSSRKEHDAISANSPSLSKTSLHFRTPNGKSLELSYRSCTNVG